MFKSIKRLWRKFVTNFITGDDEVFTPKKSDQELMLQYKAVKDFYKNIYPVNFSVRELVDIYRICNITRLSALDLCTKSYIEVRRHFYNEMLSDLSEIQDILDEKLRSLGLLVTFQDERADHRLSRYTTIKLTNTNIVLK